MTDHDTYKGSVWVFRTKALKEVFNKGCNHIPRLLFLRKEAFIFETLRGSVRGVAFTVL